MIDDYSLQFPLIILTISFPTNCSHLQPPATPSYVPADKWGQIRKSLIYGTFPEKLVRLLRSWSLAYELLQIPYNPGLPPELPITP